MTDNYEALYRKETSTFHLDYEGRHTGSYVSWLKDKLSDRDKLLSLAEARFRAAEELLDKLLVSNGAHIRRLIHGQMEYKTWLTLKKEAGE